MADYFYSLEQLILRCAPYKFDLDYFRRGWIFKVIRDLRNEENQ